MVNRVNKVNTVGMLLTLLFVGLAPGWQVYLLAEDACPEQPDYQDYYQLFNMNNQAPPVASLNLPILGPVPSDPNIWSLPCGPQRIGGLWCDPEGQACTLEVVESDLPCEASITQPNTDPNGNYKMGAWALTIQNVTPDWHVIRVRLTDTPPPDSTTPASRDVLIIFRGQEGQNLPPVLLGTWGGTS